MQPEQYTVGLCFDTTGDNLLLMRKGRPSWQKGLLNGVGGKIDPYESALACMIRKFLEEAGIRTRTDQWHFVLTLVDDTAPKVSVYFFTIFDTGVFQDAVTQDEDEPLERFDTQEFLGTLMERRDITADLQWFIPFIALDHNSLDVFPFVVPFNRETMFQQCRQRQSELHG